MKSLLTKILLFTWAVSSFFSTTAATFEVSVNQALSNVKQIIGEVEANFYLVENENTLFWSIFADTTPNAGWTHKCYLFSVPKEIVAENCNPTKREL